MGEARSRTHGKVNALVLGRTVPKEAETAGGDWRTCGCWGPARRFWLGVEAGDVRGCLRDVGHAHVGAHVGILHAQPWRSC